METSHENPQFHSVLTSLEHRLERVAGLEHPYPFRPIYEGRPASVLILCGLREAQADASSFEILITRRTAHLEMHKSQYALPGGAVDAEDGNLEDAETRIRAGLRETEEEVGISRSRVKALGVLPSIWTPTGFLVTPVLGLLKEPIERVTIVPSTEEIDFWFWCGLDRLRDPRIYSTETRKITHGGISYEVPVDVYQIGEHRVWGATAAILKNFIGRWEKLG